MGLRLPVIRLSRLAQPYRRLPAVDGTQVSARQTQAGAGAALGVLLLLAAIYAGD